MLRLCCTIHTTLHSLHSLTHSLWNLWNNKQCLADVPSVFVIWPLIWYDLFNWFDYDITSISVSLSIVKQRRKLHCVYRLWCHMTWTANFLRLSRSSQCPTQLNSSLRECPKVIHAWAPLEVARATKVMPVVVAALAKLQNWWISLHCGPSDPSEIELLNVNLKSPSGPYIHNSKQWIWWFCVK